MAQGRGSAHEIAKDYWRVAQDLGRQPTRAEYLKSGKFTNEEIETVFGSWLKLTRAVSNPPEEEEPERTPKVLVVDLENLPMEVYCYGLYDQNIGISQIIQDSTMASFAAQWLGSKEIIYHEVNWRTNPRDDSELSKKLWELMSEAEIVIGQNSISFDAKVANERFLRHKLGPCSPVKHIDTKRVAKKHFRFPSNSLEYMASRFCDSKKEKSKAFHGMDLQIECLRKNPKAWKEMRLYNMQDVRATAELYQRLKPWGTGLNRNLHTGGKVFACQECSSIHLNSRGFYISSSGKFRKYQCQSCGAWTIERGARNNLFTKAKKESLKGPK